MSASRAPLFVIVFAVVYTIAYLVAVEKNYALFTYHPALNEFAFLVEKPREGPAMYWYGWMSFAAVLASAVAGVTCLVPGPMAKRIWSGWAWTVPLAVMGFFVYLLRGYFLR